MNPLSLYSREFFVCLRRIFLFFSDAFLLFLFYSNGNQVTSDARSQQSNENGQKRWEITRYFYQT